MVLQVSVIKYLINPDSIRFVSQIDQAGFLHRIMHFSFFVWKEVCEEEYN